MLSVRGEYLVPDETVQALVGPEGTVWTQPATGEPFVLCARNATEQDAAGRFVADLLGMGLVPYGLPRTHRQTVAMFGGPILRGCTWVPWAEAPMPTDEDGAELSLRGCAMVAKQEA